MTILGLMREAQIEQANAKIGQLEKEFTTDATLSNTSQQYFRLETVSSHIGKLLYERFLFMPSWNMIKSSVPRDVQFVSVSLGADTTFRISGVSKSVSSVANFAKSLSDKPEVSVVTPLSIDKQGTSPVYNFSISFKVKPKSQKEGEL